MRPARRVVAAAPRPQCSETFESIARPNEMQASNDAGAALPLALRNEGLVIGRV